MLEASAHRHLKELLRLEGGQRWPHHLTLSRLVARSLRRSEHTLVRLAPGTDPSWWISLLVPLAVSEVPLALVVSDTLRQRLLQVEWPRLRAVGLDLPCWEGPAAPATARLWLLNHRELLAAWRAGELGERQLVLPEAEQLEAELRSAMAVRIEPGHWDSLRRAQPAAASSLLALHARLSRQVLQHPHHPQGLVPRVEAFGEAADLEIIFAATVHHPFAEALGNQASAEMKDSLGSGNISTLENPVGVADDTRQ
jgi:ATP-dependent DNA helicase DinG